VELKHAAPEVLVSEGVKAESMSALLQLRRRMELVGQVGLIGTGCAGLTRHSSGKDGDKEDEGQRSSPGETCFHGISFSDADSVYGFVMLASPRLVGF
jgi:hypothetical protein